MAGMIPFKTGQIALWIAILIAAAAGASAADIPSTSLSLDQGFHLLYELNFSGAHQVFASWQQEHPDDPMGPASEAAGLLFSEFNRLGVLESQFYVNDKAFDSRKKLAPDPAIYDRLNRALEQAESRARVRLAQNPKDRDALLAMTLASGLRADYAALIEKHNLASLHFTRDATVWSKQLLAIDPQCYDAHLATGISQYVVGSMSAPVRWLARIGGVAGDKQAGIQELQMTAEHGKYLAPFARILLAIAYVRENEKRQALELLTSLKQDFPQNPLFAREIERLDERQ
jgi:hypothetical protein